ncbi:hypothetical protein BFG07_00735 [Kosakonia cowanii]|nr:hypothetical protein BFG07_00735 [Kosakonia cowanii]
MRRKKREPLLLAGEASDVVNAVLGSAVSVLIVGNTPVTEASLTRQLTVMLDGEPRIHRRAAMMSALTYVRAVCLR